MSAHPPIQDTPNPADRIRELAAEATDSAERKSLLQSAQTVDEAHRRVVDALAQLDDTIAKSRAEMESLQKRDRVPAWVVILVLSLFFAFLAHMAVRHQL